MVLHMRNIAAGLLMVVASSGACAASYTGQIKPYFWGDGLYLRIVSGASEAYQSPCKRTRSESTRFMKLTPAIDSNDQLRRDYYSYFMAAYVAGKEVRVDVSGQCSSEGDEYILSVEMD